MSNYQEVNIAQWKRKEHYEFFSGYDNPLYNITAQVDITELYGFAKERKYSLFLCYYYAAIKAINDIPELRMRRQDGKVLLFDSVGIGTTLLQDDETISFCLLPYHTDFHQFYLHAVEQIGKIKARPGLYPATGDKNVAFFSVIPWIQFTGITHATRYQGGDSIPRFAFGKLYQHDGKWMLPLNVEVDHSLADGLHVGKFYMQMEINARILSKG